MSESFKPLLATLARGQSLDTDQATTFFLDCLAGKPSPAQVGAALAMMQLRGESLDEIEAGARALRQTVLPFHTPFSVIDTCGTGGDGHHTLNISTAAAFVAAGAGAKVAKHGTRALSSKSGSSDVLTALGVNIEASHDASRRALLEVGICFLFAPSHHSALRHVMSVRKDLGFRTLFNLIGPMANPAGAERQVMGVFAPHLVTPLAKVLGRLGAKNALVVHGADGLDEITLTGKTFFAHAHDGAVIEGEIDPVSLGLNTCDLEDLKGGDAAFNAAMMRDVLSGQLNSPKHHAYAHVVALNAGASLWISDLAPDLQSGLNLAQQALSSGAALHALDRLCEISHER